MRQQMLQSRRMADGGIHGEQTTGGLTGAADRDKLQLVDAVVFTLVELLIVIAIISILACLLLPALSMAKRMATSSQCKSNFKQIILAANFYADDYGDRLPPSHGNPPDLPTVTGVPYASVIWQAIVAVYIYPKYTIADLKYGDNYAGMGVAPNWIMKCPVTSDNSLNKMYAINGSGANNNTAGIAPEVNGWGVATTQAYGIATIKRSQLRYPSDTFAFCDSYSEYRAYQSGGVYPWQVSTDTKAIFYNVGKIYGSVRHGGAINIVYVDGHVDSRRFEEIPKDTTTSPTHFYGWGAK